MEHTITLYSMDGSAPTRLVSLLLELTQTPHNYDLVNLVAGDHHKSEHTVVEAQQRGKQKAMQTSNILFPHISNSNRNS